MLEMKVSEINKRVYMYYRPNSFSPLGVKIKIKVNAKWIVLIVNLKEKQKQNGTVQIYCISPPLELFYSLQPQSLELHVHNLSSEIISGGWERPLSQQ